MSLEVVALVAALVIGIVGAVAWKGHVRARELPDDDEPNEFLQAPPSSFPTFPTESDLLLLDAIRAEVDAETHVDAVSDHERPDDASALVAMGPGLASGELVPFELPAYDLSQLDPGRLESLDRLDALDRLDLSREGVVIDLTGSVPAAELAARLSVPLTLSDAERTQMMHTVDPVVQMLIDRVRVKQAVARGGRPGATVVRPRTTAGS